MKEDPGNMYCPFCKKGKVIRSGPAKVRISAVCSVCERAFIADLWTGRTYKPDIYKRTHKILPYHIYPCTTEGCGGKVAADGKGDVYVSARCWKCKSFFIADLQRERVAQGEAIRKQNTV